MQYFLLLILYRIAITLNFNSIPLLFYDYFTHKLLSAGNVMRIKIDVYVNSPLGPICVLLWMRQQKETTKTKFNFPKKTSEFLKNYPLCFLPSSSFKHKNKLFIPFEFIYSFVTSRRTSEIFIPSHNNTIESGIVLWVFCNIWVNSAR